MRRTRHVVLPVRSWQYMGLLIVSLACLTLGLVARDREGRHGSLAGPELLHTAPHEVDACPNKNFLDLVQSTDSSSGLVEPVSLNNREAYPEPDQTRDSRIRLSRSRSDVTRLLSSRRSSEPGGRIASSERHDSLERRKIDQYQRSRSVEPARRIRSNEARRVRSQERRITDDTRRWRIDANRARDSEIRRQDARVERRELLSDDRRIRMTENRVRGERREVRATGRQRDLSRDFRADNRFGTRIAERRSASTERRVRGESRSERRSVSVEDRRVRVMENRERQARLNPARRVREVRSDERRRDQHRSRFESSRRVRDTDLERRVRDSENQRRVRVTENERVRDLSLANRERRLSENSERRVRLARDVSRLENRRARSVENLGRIANRRDNSRVETRRVRSVEDTRARDAGLRIENRVRARSVPETRVRESRQENRREVVRARRVDAGRQENRLIRDLRLSRKAEERVAENRARDNRRIERRELTRDAERRVRDAERRVVLATRRSSDSVSRDVRDAQQRRIVNRDVRQDYRRQSDIRLDDVRREKRMEQRRVDIIGETRMKMPALYLNKPEVNASLNYEILRQAIVIGLCAAYGASFFKGKTSFIGNFAQYTNRLAVW